MNLKCLFGCDFVYSDVHKYENTRTGLVTQRYSVKTCSNCGKQYRRIEVYVYTNHINSKWERIK